MPYKNIDSLINKEFIIDESSKAWFPSKYNNDDKSNYLHHSGEYYELLVYIDSFSCTTCQIRNLYKWQQFAEQVEKKVSVKVVPVILLSLCKADTLRLKYEYQNSMPIMPVIIGDKNIWNANPWLEELKKMSIFLLDEKRRIRKKYR